MARLLLYATLVFFLICRIFSTSTAQETNECTEVSQNLFPCIEYLSGLPNIEIEPTSSCCDGILKLNQRAKRVKGDAGRICECIEDIAYVMNIQFQVSRIQSLPEKCHLHFSFPISIGMDCSKV